ncbi:DUF3108 domain-containing protein [Aestuariibacter sp. AA17]|uniref:DUF3108 domain-containing protein n=1 Tax=Fluctibacter corallii TaxID=2984329 RepID=A0ABT3A5S0_9ALTE|nr:DUF3108 domain-containing protein [Aestuariibacter sp. AA17]MCV2884036.1 DUF3108 domain-containing protein [Aestuariibacter sp. AA17]
MEMKSLKMVMQQIKQYMNKRLCSVALTMALTTVSTLSFALEAFDAQYKAFRHGRELGTASIELDALGRDKYRLTYHSKVSLFFLSDERTETSLFSVRDDNIVPHTYEFVRTGTGKDRKLEAQFDAENSTVTFARKPPVDWNGELDNQLYRLDVQQKLAEGLEQFDYTLINYRGEKRHYGIEVLGKETLTLPYGNIESVKVKIVRESKRRETFAWFAPSLNYQLVRLQQFKDGDEQGDIRLSQFTLASDDQTTAANK